MEREIEVKLLDIDIENFEEKIKALGAEFVREEEQTNITINSTAHKIYKKDGYLRIRIAKSEEGEKKYFTFKENISNVKVRDNIEHTTEVSNVEDLINILKCLGYDKFHKGFKNRKKYTLNGLIIDIDTWDKKTYPKPYVEIEAPSMEEIYSLVDKLGINRESVSTMSIDELRKSLKKIV
ncbi:class IV adenylate cyclase [Peptoniphilus lacydonensis]|uniref:class IV adenylate cyclase n=1 Tax=Peptoniphilus lacydonensis TaxID=1673725 RepID=UPI002900BE63|nr:class IV adenylate cyclase [Peptoniphilus lacydonensis]MDU1954704.1 class IV adenylate cyclase [Peptoniphilus lacydonensis]MDU5275311.1 class IV adenylate cyclase [Peptoniphilus lacydonensis]MDU5377200.1 class IV adenylate cyclase [Peptoniphilus lacydonensis]MDU5437539.1 class IV adenylate cyclase [Peptoniphilus lacydonensis]